MMVFVSTPFYRAISQSDKTYGGGGGADALLVTTAIYTISAELRGGRKRRRFGEHDQDQQEPVGSLK